MVFDVPILLAEPQMLKGKQHIEGATLNIIPEEQDYFLLTTLVSNHVPTNGLLNLTNLGIVHILKFLQMKDFLLMEVGGLQHHKRGASLFQIDNGPLSAEYTWSLAKSEWDSEL